MFHIDLELSPEFRHSFLAVGVMTTRKGLNYCTGEHTYMYVLIQFILKP